jgi:hypothetical protein
MFYNIYVFQLLHLAVTLLSKNSPSVLEGVPSKRGRELE